MGMYSKDEIDPVFRQKPIDQSKCSTLQEQISFPHQFHLQKTGPVYWRALESSPLSQEVWSWGMPGEGQEFSCCVKMFVKGNNILTLRIYWEAPQQPVDEGHSLWCSIFSELVSVATDFLCWLCRHIFALVVETHDHLGVFSQIQR